MNRLILASRSPARARLLAEAGLDFEIKASRVDEQALKTSALQDGLTPREIAVRLAEAKARDVAQLTEGLAIGADQTLDLDGRLFDKPVTLDAARAQLMALRGRTHQLHAAIALVDGHRVVWRTVQSVSLQVRGFSDAFLDAYLAREGEALLGCVGAYRLEGLGVQLFEQIDGDYFTVLGLPLLPLLAALRTLGHLAP